MVAFNLDESESGAFLAPGPGEGVPYRIALYETVLATAVTGFAFALGPGHNIPLSGGTPAVGKELAIMMAIIVVSALVLVEEDARLSALQRGRLRNC
jgi:hypothetical protein